MSPNRTLGYTTHVVWRWRRGTSETLSGARTAARCAFEQLGYPADVIDNLALVVSELVANAQEHAVGPYEMRLHRNARVLICEIEDHDPRIPQIPAFSTPNLPEPEYRGGGLEALCALLSERGRGLHIVNELTNGAWGFRRCSAAAKAA